MKEKADKYFNANTLEKEVFVTSDGFLFKVKKDAINHTTTLNNKDVETFQNKVSTEIKEGKTNAKDNVIFSLKAEEAIEHIGLLSKEEAIELNAQEASRKKPRITVLKAFEEHLKTFEPPVIDQKPSPTVAENTDGQGEENPEENTIQTQEDGTTENNI